MTKVRKSRAGRPVTRATVSVTRPRLRRDIRALVEAITAWLTRPPFSRIIPDLAAESARTPELATAIAATIGEPRRAVGRKRLERAIARGELPADTDLEMAQDLVAGLVYWRMVVRRSSRTIRTA